MRPVAPEMRRRIVTGPTNSSRTVPRSDCLPPVDRGSPCGAQARSSPASTRRAACLLRAPLGSQSGLRILDVGPFIAYPPRRGRAARAYGLLLALSAKNDVRHFGREPRPLTSRERPLEEVPVTP